MKKISKKASVFIYILVLVMITMFLGMIIFSINSSLENDRKVENIENILISNIGYKAKLAIKYDKWVNSDWSWFIDNLSCPDNVYMQWDNWNSFWNINSHLVSPSISSWAYCYWTYIRPWNTKNFYIYFNWDYTDFKQASYIWEVVDLTSSYIWQFSDSDNTKMTFTNHPWKDNIDDNFNSDNYKTNSTWSINYPNKSNWKPYWDNDANARKIMYSYVYPEASYTNIFWSNTKINNFIASNSNNSDSNLNLKIWDISNWSLFIDIDKKADLKLIVFDKTRFNTSWELKAKEIFNKSYTWWVVWYLQNDLSISDTQTPSDFSFDFTNNDYALFLKNNSSAGETILYKIMVFDKNTWKWVYIVPLNDSDSQVIEYLWYDIIQKKEDFIYKISKVYWEK